MKITQQYTLYMHIQILNVLMCLLQFENNCKCPLWGLKMQVSAIDLMSN